MTEEENSMPKTNEVNTTTSPASHSEDQHVSPVTSGDETSRRIPSIDGDLSDSDRAARKKKRTPKRILHFSDGVIEEYSSDEEPQDERPSPPLKPVVDPRTLTWMPWLYWRAWSTGGSLVSVLDSVGEKFAWWMGITSPKYYYEIQEALRMKEEEEKRKADEDAEMAGWRDSRSSAPETARRSAGSARMSQPTYQTCTETTPVQQTQN